MASLELKQVDYELRPSGYEIVEGEPTALRGLHTPDIGYEDVVQRLEEGNDTYDILKGASGRRYEIVIFNAGKLSVARILKPTTSYSSAYKNPANMLQTSFEAAANPDAAYISVASFGNHPTGAMSFDDLVMTMRTGRYTTGYGTENQPYRALGSVEDMAETISNHLKANPTHLSADAEAGRLGLGLMTAFETDSIQQGYLNGIDGISHSANYVPARLSEDVISRMNRKRLKNAKPGELTPDNIKDTKQRMPNIYHGLGRIAHIAPLPVLLFPKDDMHKAMITAGFMRNDNLDNLQSHAVYQDIRAAMLEQDATLTLQFNAKSAIHELEDCKRFGKLVMDSIPQELRTDSRRIRLIIGQGSLDYHTDSPHERTRVERLALNGILHKFSVFRGLSPAEIYHLHPFRKSA
jgi:hypothetical protein